MAGPPAAAFAGAFLRAGLMTHSPRAALASVHASWATAAGALPFALLTGWGRLVATVTAPAACCDSTGWRPLRDWSVAARAGAALEGKLVALAAPLLAPAGTVNTPRLTALAEGTRPEGSLLAAGGSGAGADERCCWYAL